MCGLGPGLSGAVFFVWKLCDNLFWGAKCKKKMFFFFCLTLCFSWKNRESQQRSWWCARVFWRIEKKKKEGKKWRFSLLVHYSQSLPESCRMRILRLVSKSQRSIFELKCRQKFNLSPGTPKVFDLCACMHQAISSTCTLRRWQTFVSFTCLIFFVLIFFCSPLVFFSFFANMVCPFLSLYLCLG